MSLDDFFRAMAPMLSGTDSVHSVETALGTSPSGSENLAFYGTLVERNHFKILGDIFGPVRTLFLRELPGQWRKVVRAYRSAHPCAHWDPNRFGEHFGEFLQSMRADGALPSAVFEELADLSYIRQRAFSGNESDPSAYDNRVFVRQYTYPTSDFFFELLRDSAAPIPDERPQVVFVYRHFRDDSVRHFLPSAAGLAALARRQGVTELPAMFSTITTAQLDSADQILVEHGVFEPRDQ